MDDPAAILAASPAAKTPAAAAGISIPHMALPLSERMNECAASIKEALRTSGVPSVSIGVFYYGENVYSHHAAQDEIRMEHAGGDKVLFEPLLPYDETMYPGSCLNRLFRTCTVLRFAQDRVLDIDVPIRQYLHAFRERHDGIGQYATLRDLLMHRAGYPPDDVWWKNTTLSKEETIQVAVHLSAVSPFRIYRRHSQWNDFLVEALLEAVTGREFKEIVEEFFVIPLGIKGKKDHPFEKPNVAVGYKSVGNGHVIPATRRQTNSELYQLESSLRQCVHTLCKMLTAYSRQKESKSVITPSNPFVRLETLFGIMEKPVEPNKFIRCMERTDGCEAVYLLIPETRSGVVCMSNAASASSLCDVVGRQFLAVLTKYHLEERSTLKVEERSILKIEERSVLKVEEDFKFLSLPAEIRNMIYVEALRTSSGSVCLIPTGNAIFFATDERPSDGVTKPINRIKSVSRQLMRESRGFELVANDLVADARDFDSLLASSDVHLKSCLRNVTLLGDSLSFENPDEAALHRIVNFASTHQQATIHVRLSDLNMDPGRRIFTFVNNTYIILAAIRSQHHSRATGARLSAKKWGRLRRNGIQTNLSNVRFFPRDPEFDEGLFRDALESSERRKTNSYYILMLHHGGSNEAVIEHIRDCYEVGM